MATRPTVAAVFRAFQQFTQEEREQFILRIADDITTAEEHVNGDDDWADGQTVVMVVTAEDVLNIIDALPEDEQERLGVIYLDMFRDGTQQIREELLAEMPTLVASCIRENGDALRTLIRRRGPIQKENVIQVLRLRDDGRSFGQIGQKFGQTRDWAEKIYLRWNPRRAELGL